MIIPRSLLSDPVPPRSIPPRYTFQIRFLQNTALPRSHSSQNPLPPNPAPPKHRSCQIQRSPPGSTSSQGALFLYPLLSAFFLPRFRSRSTSCQIHSSRSRSSNPSFQQITLLPDSLLPDPPPDPLLPAPKSTSHSQLPATLSHTPPMHISSQTPLHSHRQCRAGKKSSKVGMICCDTPPPLFTLSWFGFCLVSVEGNGSRSAQVGFHHPT